MKKNILMFLYIILMVFSVVPSLYAFDAATKINLRNSYSAFENCMELSKNDIWSDDANDAYAYDWGWD